MSESGAEQKPVEAVEQQQDAVKNNGEVETQQEDVQPEEATVTGEFILSVRSSMLSVQFHRLQSRSSPLPAPGPCPSHLNRSVP